MDTLTAVGKSAPDRATGEDIDRALVENAKAQLRKLDAKYDALLSGPICQSSVEEYDRMWDEWIALARPYERILEA